MSDIPPPIWSTELPDRAREIIAGFFEHDMTALAALTPDEREAQAAARFDLVLHLTRIWNAPEEASAGAVPATQVPGFAPVAAMLDIANALLANVQNTQAEAGDEEGELP
jgi:hypothetical protein